MKQLDADFMALYSQYDIDTPPAGAGEVDKTLVRVLAGQPAAIPFDGAATRPARRRTLSFAQKRVAVAVAAVCAILLLAAGTIKVADLFRNILSEPGANGQPAPLASMAPVVNQTGALPGTSVTSGGVAVTVQGLVGDNNSLKVLLDVAGPEGRPLALRQPDGTYSQGEVRFGEVWLTPADPSDSFGFGMSSAVIDNDPSDNRMSILLDFTAGGQSLQGGKYTLSLRDLMQFATLDGTALALAPGQLHDAVAGFAAPADSAFEKSGYHEDTPGQPVYDYLLAADSGSEVALVPGHTLTNAAVRDGLLYLRGHSGDMAAFEDMKDNAVLRDEGGNQLATISSCSWDEETGVWSISFDGIQSLDALKNAVWWYGTGEGLHRLASGSWDVELDLSYANLAAKATLGEAFNWDGCTFTAETLEVSPYTVQLSLAADAQTANEIMPQREGWGYVAPTAWDAATHTIRLRMKDGSTVESDNCASAASSLEGGGGSLQYTFVLDVVIDPANVESVSIGDLTVDAERLVAQ